MRFNQYTIVLLVGASPLWAAETSSSPAADTTLRVAEAVSATASAVADGALNTAPDEPPTKPDFMVAAGLQLEAGEYIEAERALAVGINDLEQTLPRYDMQLVKPLGLLGDAQFGKGDYEAARDSYSRAVHVARVNDGLHTPEQVPLVYKEAEALAAQGKLDAANGRQEYAFETLQRAYGPTSESLVPGMYALAAWYKRTHNIYSARELYAHAVDTLARVHGPDSPELVLPLRGVAETYRQERFPPYIAPSQRETVSIGTVEPRSMTAVQQRTLVVNRFSDGERALGQIIKILNDDPASPRLEVVLAVLDLADWHLLFEKDERAFTLYGRVHALLVSEAGLGPEDLAKYFGAPTPLYLPMPSDPEAPPPALRSRATEGYVELAYTITEHGRVTALETLGAEPPGLMDIKVRRAMRIARFRPRFEDGRPVATEHLKYRHRFIYYPAPEAPAPDADRDPTDGTGPQAAAATPKLATRIVKGAS